MARAMVRVRVRIRVGVRVRVRVRVKVRIGARARDVAKGMPWAAARSPSSSTTSAMRWPSSASRVAAKAIAEAASQWP